MWVIVNRYDLDETFSPPSHDDSFFYIRYPKTDTSSQRLQDTNFHQASELLEKSEQISKQDFSQHTLQCRQFIPEAMMDSSTHVGEQWMYTVLFALYVTKCFLFTATHIVNVCGVMFVLYIFSVHWLEVQIQFYTLVSMNVCGISS
jgi:hypothetical protein